MSSDEAERDDLKMDDDDDRDPIAVRSIVTGNNRRKLLFRTEP